MSFVYLVHQRELEDKGAANNSKNKNLLSRLYVACQVEDGN